MKKLLAVLVIFVCVGAALSALDLSAGLGGAFDASFGSFVLTQDAKDAGMEAEDFSNHYAGGGFYAFFDATYVEADIGLLFGSAKQDTGSSDPMDLTHLRLALYGKYPIDLGGFTLFPLLGIDYLINTSAKEDGEDVEISGYDKGEVFDQFWFRLGVGADFGLGEKIYLRPTFTYGIRLNSQMEKDELDDSSAYLDGIVGHGLEFRVALGFKL